MMMMTKTRRPPPYRESSRGGTGTFTNTARGAEAPSNVNDDAISTAIRTIRDDEAMATAIREFMRDIPTPEGAVMFNITLKTLPEKYDSILKHREPTSVNDLRYFLSDLRAVLHHYPK